VQQSGRTSEEEHGEQGKDSRSDEKGEKFPGKEKKSSPRAMKISSFTRSRSKNWGLSM